jgi:hypothetical protein
MMIFCLRAIGSQTDRGRGRACDGVGVLLLAFENLVSVLESVANRLQCCFVLLYAIFSSTRRFGQVIAQHKREPIGSLNY